MQIKALDFFRVYGAFLIFLCHLPWFNLPYGNIGVTLFFVLSGFVANISSAGKVLKVRPYIYYKFRRLYPIYILTTILGALYMILILRLSLGVTLLKFPIFAMMLQTVVYFVRPTGFNGPGWYVATLFVIFLIFICVKSTGLGRKWGLILFFIYSIIWLYLLPLILQENIYQKLNYFSPLSRVIDFGVGFCAAYIANAYRKMNVKPLYINLLELSGLLILICISAYPSFLSFELEMLSFCALYIIFSKDEGVIQRLISRRCICVLSRYTYSFYLIHYLVIMMVKNLILPQLASHGFITEGSFSSPLYIYTSLSCFIVSMMFAYILNLYQSKILTLIGKTQNRMAISKRLLA